MIKNLKNETDLSGFYFIYKGSTNLEQKGTYGLAHAGEHLKCKAFDDLQDELQANGISWNAYTSSNNIVFYFTGLEEYLAPYRDVIIERMYLPFEDYISVDAIENEKKIVLEEYGDSFNSQNETFFMNFMRKKFNHYSPIGLREDIENLTFDICKDFFEKQYNKPDMIINISKTFEYKNDNLLFEDRAHLLRDDFFENLEAPLEDTAEYPNTTTMHYYKKIDSLDIPILKIINSMLCSGLNSPIYQEIREKRALCYYVGGNLTQIGKLNLIEFTILTSPDKVGEADTTLSDVLNNRDLHLTSNRLETIRKASIISKKKSLINRHTNINDILDENVDILNNIIENVSLEEILTVYDKYYDLSTFIKVDDKTY